MKTTHFYTLISEETPSPLAYVAGHTDQPCVFGYKMRETIHDYEDQEVSLLEAILEAGYYNFQCYDPSLCSI